MNEYFLVYFSGRVPATYVRTIGVDEAEFRRQNPALKISRVERKAYETARRQMQFLRDETGEMVFRMRG